MTIKITNYTISLEDLGITEFPTWNPNSPTGDTYGGLGKISQMHYAKDLDNDGDSDLILTFRAIQDSPARYPDDEIPYFPILLRNLGDGNFLLLFSDEVFFSSFGLVEFKKISILFFKYIFSFRLLASFKDFIKIDAVFPFLFPKLFLKIVSSSIFLTFKSLSISLTTINSSLILLMNFEDSFIILLPTSISNFLSSFDRNPLTLFN